MVRIINPAKPDDLPLTKSEVLFTYNGLDTCITREVFDEISPQLTPNTQKIYDFSRALQAPVLDMCLRGVRVDEAARKTLLTYYLGKVKHYTGFLDTLAHAVWDKPLNPDSPAQLQFFFYRVMGYPVIKSRKGREMKVSTDRAALEQLSLQHIYARPIIQIILALRDAKGSVETLLRGIDDDGRYRAAYNIAGTVTGRWSSSKNIFGRGGNLQNVTDKLRRMFVPDPGKKLAYIDLEQAESRAVGFICREIFGVDTYLKSCGSGDLHTTVCVLNWPELPWTGDLVKDRKIAETPFYRDLTYRDMAKKLGHGCLTEDHEVLTSAGWVSIAEKPENICIYDDLDDSYTQAPVLAWVDKQYVGDMHSFESEVISAYMTGNHRVPYRKQDECGLTESFACNGPIGDMPFTFWSTDHSYLFTGWEDPADVDHKVVQDSVRVFCPTVSTGWFLARRNGKMFVTGNSNYGGSPPVMAMHTKVDKHIIEVFQDKYFTAFPELKQYHEWVKKQLKDAGVITNPFGRERRFFGRSDDHKVINEGIAYTPQSLVADMLNNGLLEIYRLNANKGLPIELLMQVHDAVVVQYASEHEDELMFAALACLEAPLAGTDFWIPSDCQTGWNWAKATKPWKEGTKAKPGDKFHIPEIGFLFQAKEPTETRPDPSNKIWKMLEEQSNPRGISGYKRPKVAA